MPRYDITVTENALLVFADIIESSKYSSTLGYIKYANRLIEFQRIFEEIGLKYFPTVDDPTKKYSELKARGDEGLLFYLDNSIDKSELIYKAIEFIYEVKGRLKLFLISDEDPPAKGMKLGAGIHYGPVALVTRPDKDEKGKKRSIIDRLEGFSINFAKRIESASRSGNLSQIYVSKEAANIIKGQPIILEKHRVPLRGIEDNIDIYEVFSGFFPEIPIAGENHDDERFVNYLNELADNPSTIDDKWLKALIVSTLFSRAKKVPMHIYQRRLLSLVWNSPDEDDPVILFIRAYEYEKENSQTLRIEYLQKILNRFPMFTPAKIKLIDAYWKLASKEAERVERIFARDGANEYYRKFLTILTEDEKALFEKIISDLND
jgi:hypothetical protein